MINIYGSDPDIKNDIYFEKCKNMKRVTQLHRHNESISKNNLEVDQRQIYSIFWNLSTASKMETLTKYPTREPFVHEGRENSQRHPHQP